MKFRIPLAVAFLFSPLTLLAGDLDDAIRTGGFPEYLKGVTTWLNERVPDAPGEDALELLLSEPLFRTTLGQGRLISKIGAAPLGVFALENPANGKFLAWLLQNTEAMDLYLEGAVPIGLAERETDTYKLRTAALEIWKRILDADPETREGLPLKLAIATALAPPGSVNIGAGGAKTPADPVVRYKYYKAAHRNGELFSSFDHLTVWEYTKIVSSGASDADLSWAREMINTFRPDLRADEQVVNSTSFVWRRAAPAEFYPNGGYQNFRNVLAGGGKCGPRSSWSVMVCQAFGIPAIGVGQPAHACVAYKAANPMTQPQPGSAWKVAYGRGWDVSRLEGMTGPDFLAGVEKRSDLAKFSRVEHLRWLASALTAADKAAAVMAIAHKINDSITSPKTDLTASLKPEEAEADPGVKAAAKDGRPKDLAVTGSAPPVKAVAGAIHVEAASFSKTGGQISWGGQIPHVLIHECFTGGRQVYFQQQMKEQWADYALEVPAAGTYEITLQAACVNADQVLEVCSGGTVIATVPIPLSYGLWQLTKPVALRLENGLQTLRVQTPTTEHKRGIALRWFELKPRP
jgi:hypothetical protein